MKQKHEFKNVVAETLLIPLYMRAKESRREHPILDDKVAERLADSLEYDYSQFDGAKLSEVGCVVRGWYFDCAVKRFIDTSPSGSRECGMRAGHPFPAYRQPESGFYDMDLPEVIALRRELIPEEPGNVCIEASLLETDWMDDLRRETSRCGFCIYSGRRADVFLREAGKSLSASRGRPFRGEVNCGSMCAAR